MSTSISLGDALRLRVTPFIALSDHQISLLEGHFEILRDWNRRLNLTTVTDVDQAATRHYGESLFLASHLSPGSVVDVGSGAGFPGIPAAVLRPECHFDLVESHKRKAVFLREAARGLRNVRVVAERAESLAPHYDWMVSRAVRPDDVVRLELGRSVALLASRVDAVRLSHFELIPLPWGENRVLALRRP
jgi:16S rRNA G527 N7-methylase RsmG